LNSVETINENNHNLPKKCHEVEIVSIENQVGNATSIGKALSIGNALSTTTIHVWASFGNN